MKQAVSYYITFLSVLECRIIRPPLHENGDDYDLAKVTDFEGTSNIRSSLSTVITGVDNI